MADTATKTLAEFIAENRITMTCTWVDSNPSMPDSADMDHWKCVLARPQQPVVVNGVLDMTGRRLRMTVPFSMGYGHKGAELKLSGVLDCLASDASGIENAGSFEDWCDEYGYDADSRKAEKTFKACKHSAARLKRFLGDDAYSALLWNTERE